VFVIVAVVIVVVVVVVVVVAGVVYAKKMRATSTSDPDRGFDNPAFGAEARLIPDGSDAAGRHEEVLCEGSSNSGYIDITAGGHDEDA
jgi:hypothetical protein